MTEVTVKENIDGEPYIQLPDEVVAKLGWKEGDDVEFIKNKNGSLTIRKIDTTRYARVVDSMYCLDEECNKVNEQFIHTSLPRFDKDVDEDGQHPLENYKVEVLCLGFDSYNDGRERELWPCSERAKNKVEFQIVYDGMWNGNGREYQTGFMTSLTKPRLLEIADEAMVYTGNEHHCFLENLRFDKIEEGVVILRLCFGS